jgi:hypothetical protein
VREGDSHRRQERDEIHAAIGLLSKSDHYYIKSQLEDYQRRGNSFSK